MGRFGQKKEEARKAVAGGGKTSGRRAADATQVGHLGDDDKVYHRGKVVGNFSGRQRKQPNQNEV